MITVDPTKIEILKFNDEKTKGELKPHEHMDPWMFIPVYLEVCYRTCSTVFLRSPVPSPNNVEIPSPLPPVWHQLGYEWYSRIKRNETKAPIKPQLILAGKALKLKPKFDDIVRRDIFKKNKEVFEIKKNIREEKIEAEREKFQAARSREQ